MAENTINTKELCSPNYEEEYYRLNEEVNKLKQENFELKETILGMCKSYFGGKQWLNT